MKRFLSWISRISTLKSVIAILIIFMTFIVFVLPSESAKSAAMNLHDSIDTALFSTGADLYRIAGAYGEEGRSFYITQRFTFDLVWPIVYAFFLLITSTYLTLKSGLGKYLSVILAFTLIGACLDFLENITASIVMFRYPSETPIIADICGFATLFKWFSLAIAFIVLLGLVMTYCVQKIRSYITNKGSK